MSVAAMSTVPSAIRRRRRILGLTQRELADQAGVSLRTVVAIESESANPRLSVLDACCGVLGLDVSIVEKP